MELPYWLYHLFSLTASFALTYWLYGIPRSIIFALALAVLLYILFGPLALPAFFLAVGARALINRGSRAARTKR